MGHELSGEVGPSQIGHQDVRDQQIDGPSMGGSEAKGLAARLRRQHDVAMTLECHLHQSL